MTKLPPIFACISESHEIDLIIEALTRLLTAFANRAEQEAETILIRFHPFAKLGQLPLDTIY